MADAGSLLHSAISAIDPHNCAQSKVLRNRSLLRAIIRQITKVSDRRWETHTALPLPSYSKLLSTLSSLEIYEASCNLLSLQPLSLPQKLSGKKLRLKNNYRHCHRFGKSCARPAMAACRCCLIGITRVGSSEADPTKKCP